MARTPYGGSPADVIAVVTADDGDLAPAQGSLTVWTAETGGSQLVDLTDKNGAAITAVTPVAPYYRVRFNGPDGYTAAVWVQDTDGNRWRFDPADLASRVGGVSSVQVNNGTLQTGAVALSVPTVDSTESVPGLPAALDSKIAAASSTAGDGLVRTVSSSGALVKLVDTSVTPNRTTFQRARTGLVTRNGVQAREVVGWRTGDPDPTAAGTIPLPSNVLYVILLAVGETVPTWAEGVSIVAQATS